RWRAALVRRIWIGMALALVVTAGALVLYARPSASWRHAYVASQSVQVVAVTEASGSSYDAYLARQESERIARSFAGGGIQSAAFDDAVVRSFAAQHAALVTWFGADVPTRVSSGDVAAALVAQDTGGLLTLTCRWNSAAGANALLSTAVSVLAGAGDLRRFLGASTAAQSAEVALAQPTGAIVMARLDASTADAARQELLARIALGVVFGLAAVLLLAALSLRSGAARVTQPMPAPEATPDTAATGNR
ncbi:MAG: hypothetical protein ACRDHP_07515, partial [Ktedonobacterales bacterium]